MMRNWEVWHKWSLMNWNQPGFRTGIGMLVVWSLFWKGLALWKAARNDERYWFVALLILNTGGLLELAYLFVFAKQKLVLVSDPKPPRKSRI